MFPGFKDDVVLFFSHLYVVYQLSSPIVMLYGDYLLIYFLPIVLLQSVHLEEKIQLICLHISVFTGRLNSDILGNAGPLNAYSKFLGKIE